jgi:hypothetical protein
LGSYLCLFPGLVVYGLFLPAFALAADGESIGGSFSKSFEGMKTEWLMSALFVLVLGLVYIFGTVLTCGLGFFVTIPMIFICSSLAYRDMVGMPGAPTAMDGGMAGYAGYAQQAGIWPPAPGQQQPPANPYAPQQAPPQQYGQPPNPGQQTSTPHIPGMGMQPPPPPTQPENPYSAPGSEPPAAEPSDESDTPSI